MSDEFYVGYESSAPPAMAVRVRRVASSLVVVVLATAVLALLLHEPLQPSRFEFGRPRRAEGVLTRRPYPVLDIAGRTVWLVGQGKHGAGATLGSTPDGIVQLRGTMIARGPHEMLEVEPGSVQSIAGVPTAPIARGHPAPADTDEDVTLTGEVVDSKCFLGVMNPGEGTVHRDCARLCLRGGIPPMLLVRSEQGDETLVLLVGTDGGAIGPELAALAGQAVRVRGRLSHDNGVPVLHADPAAYRRPPPR